MSWIDMIRASSQMDRLRFVMFLILFAGLCHLSWRTGRLVDLSSRAIDAQEHMVGAIDLMMTSKHAESFLVEHHRTQSKIDALSEQMNTLLRK